jgi:tetratricopeptide (TPR) repeat protein/class 3 adenylate cyclase
MKKRFIVLPAFLLLCTIHFSLLLVAQQANLAGRQASLDSLWNIWQDKTKHDTTRLKALNQFTNDGYLNAKPDSAIYFAQLEYDFAKSKGLKKQMSSALNMQGVSYFFKGNYPKAMGYYQKCLAIDNELGNKMGIARSFLNIGNIYSSQGNYTKAMEYFQKCMAIHEELGNKKGIANLLIANGNIYYNQGNYPQALEQFQKSLAIQEELGNQKGIANSMHSIGMIYHEQGNYPNALKHYLKCLEIQEDLANKPGISASLNGIGNIYLDQGNYPKALAYFQKCLAIEEEMGDKAGMASSLHNIGVIYSAQNNYPQTLAYYQKSLAIEQELGNQYGIANSLQSIGNIYHKESNYSKAFEYYQQCLEIMKELGNKQGIAGSMRNIGEIYKSQGQYQKALEYYQQSLTLNKALGNKKGLAHVLNSIGRINRDLGNNTKAIENCKKGLALAKSIEVLEEQKTACECLYDTYKAMGNGNEALKYLEEMNAVNDSLNAQESVKKLQQMEFAKQLLQDSMATAEKEQMVQEVHEAAIGQEKKTRNWSIAGGILGLLMAVGFYSRWRYVKKSRAALQVEKDRSENLLLNILPEEIANELKEKGRADARDFEMVSILFSDFKGFTQISEKLGAAELLNEVGRCFEAFDSIMEKYGIEKIKTIGDAYMAAGGLPIPAENSVKNTVLAGIEMQEFISKRKEVLDLEGKHGFEMRVGIHTGPVVAGIVGVKKFQYDIWGDTVNTASRLESSGEVGKVNVSETIFNALKEDPQFSFQNRGKLAAKGKGEIEMYYVSKTEMKG